MITDLLPIETTICERSFFVHIYGADYVAFSYLFEATQTGELFFEELGIYMYIHVPDHLRSSANSLR
jgi:hypothetical protein